MELRKRITTNGEQVPISYVHVTRLAVLLSAKMYLVGWALIPVPLLLEILNEIIGDSRFTPVRRIQFHLHQHSMNVAVAITGRELRLTYCRGNIVGKEGINRMV